jgi:methyl-accepting chemotaxis protein
MNVRRAFRIRAQIILLTVVPLAFLLVMLVLLLMLARTTERSAALSLKGTAILARSGAITEGVGHMSRSVQNYARSHNTSDLSEFDAAREDISEQSAALLDLVRGNKALEAAAARYVKDNADVVVLFTKGRAALQAGHPKVLVQLISAPATKKLGVEVEQARVAMSEGAERAGSLQRIANAASFAGTERVLLFVTALGVVSTIVLAVLFGLRLARRLEILSENARRLNAGQIPLALGGSDEIAELGGVYGEMFADTMRSRAQLADAKARLERAVFAYGDLATQVAAGDLSARVVVDDPNDELGVLGTSLNAMAASLERLVDEIRGAATSLASATAEILAATSQQVASATEEATAVRQTAVTVLEVRQTAETAAHRTRMVVDLAQRVHQTADDGRHSVEESVRGTIESRERMEVLAERILAFSDQAQSIAEINATVATLAEQSNLLAVNAGIEAAKAGEAGRGFAVVAGEVKELGARSKEATLQVRRIVAEIQRSAQNAVIAAEAGMRVAQSGTTVAQRSGEAMDVLASSIAEASAAAQQISASAEQQQAGMDQIALAMQSIEQASVQSVAATQQVERAANDLSRLAQQLTDTIARHVRGNGSTTYDLIS